MTSNVTVVGIAISGNPEAVVNRRGNGVTQQTRSSTGTIWLCPQGVAEDQIRITDQVPEMLHIYLSSAQFDALANEDGYRHVGAEVVRYEAGFEDLRILEIGRIIRSELAAESSSGRLVVEAAGLSLTALLLSTYSTLAACEAARHGCRRALSSKRIRRVFEYIEANLEHDISLGDLAAVACLSPYHFSRAFRSATGRPPHRYVSDRRLDRAKALLTQGDASLADIALTCNFSSQANFTRAFSRTVGLSPGEFRRRLS